MDHFVVLLEMSDRDRTSPNIMSKFVPPRFLEVGSANIGYSSTYETKLLMYEELGVAQVMVSLAGSIATRKCVWCVADRKMQSHQFVLCNLKRFNSDHA